MRDRDGTLVFAAGDTITIDGTSGEVWLGAPEETAAGSTESDEEILGRHLPHLVQLESWAGASAVPVPEA